MYSMKYADIIKLNFPLFGANQSHPEVLRPHVIVTHAEGLCKFGINFYLIY